MVYVDRTAGERQRRYREKRKMEDETRGSTSDLNPKSFKKDMTVQAWMDSRYIATLSRYLDEEYRTKYLSEVLQEGIRILVDSLVKAGKVKMIEGSDEARDELEWKYRIDLRKYFRRGAKNAVHNDVLTERVRENRIDSIKINEPDRENVIQAIDSGNQSDFMKRWREAEKSGAINKIASSRMIEEAKEREINNRYNHPNLIDEDDLAALNAKKVREVDEKVANMPDVPLSKGLVKLDNE